MSRLRAWIRSFFGFSRSETNAFLILLPLMALLIFSEPVHRYWFIAQQPRDFDNEKNELDSLTASWSWTQRDSAIGKSLERRLFSFDPNTVSNEDLIQLGFNRTLAHRMVNYRMKGGKFTVKKDLMKIYGMDSTLYRRLYAFVDLPEKVEKENVVKSFGKKETSVIEKFDLNTADTTQLIKVYGIGSKLSRRIVTYRDKLGGFVSRAQLTEVYGLDSAVIRELFKKSFIHENFKPRVININTAPEKELGEHPYIKYKLAKAITTYRFQHGAYNSVDDLKKIVLIDNVKFEKIKPYLSANP